MDPFRDEQFAIQSSPSPVRSLVRSLLQGGSSGAAILPTGGAAECAGSPGLIFCNSLGAQNIETTVVVCSEVKRVFDVEWFQRGNLCLLGGWPLPLPHRLCCVSFFKTAHGLMGQHGSSTALGIERIVPSFLSLL